MSDYVLVERRNGLDVVCRRNGKYEVLDDLGRLMRSGDTNLDRTLAWCDDYLESFYIEHVDYRVPQCMVTYYGPFSRFDAEVCLDDQFGNALAEHGDVDIVQLGAEQALTSNIYSADYWRRQVLSLCA